MNVALTNLIVLSINSMDKGGFIVHYNVLAKIGHVVGPLLNILVTFLPPIKRRLFYFNALPYENLEYLYISISVFCILRIYASFALRNARRPNLIPSKIKEDFPDRNLGTYFRDESVNYSSGRYSYLPWIVFSTNILTTLGSGLSISIMGIYMIEEFKIDFMKLWISSLMIPIFTTILLFILNSYQKRHGKLVTIFISKLIALLASFQNAPGPLKTSIVLQCSNLKSASYWLSSEYLSRIIMAGMTMLGGHIHMEYGFKYCFILTGTLCVIIML
uniref:Uncharacterized protein n=1 Tax=Theileria annulata TaxID=5874 RepID=A0A3B0MXX1_THEAN